MGRRAGLPVVYKPTASTAVFWCRFTLDGVRHRLSTGCRDQGAAEAEARRLHGLASLGKLPGGKQRRVPAYARTPLIDQVVKYLEWARANGKADSYVRKQEGHLARYMTRWQSIDQITTKAIEEYKVDRRTENQKLRLTTLYKELVTLSRLLHWCKKAGHLDDVPHFDRFKPVTDYVPPNTTPEEIDRVLRELPDRKTHPKRLPVREFYVVQWSQGLRPCDVQRLLWHHVDMAAKKITIAASNDKARTGRVLPMTKESIAVFRELAKRPHAAMEPVFGNRSYRRSLQLAIERAGVSRFTPHGFRHARLTELASETRDTAAVQFIAGHKNLSTTDRYVRSRTERAQAVFDAVSGKQRMDKRKRKSYT